MSSAYWNMYTDDHWPNDWDDEDIECLNPFLRTEFNAEIVQLVNNPDYDWALVKHDE